MFKIKYQPYAIKTLTFCLKNLALTNRKTEIKATYFS